jgi:hypothetical protein
MKLIAFGEFRHRDAILMDAVRILNVKKLTITLLQFLEINYDNLRVYILK